MISFFFFKKHVLRRHPENAAESIYACDKCKFMTINQRKYELHVLNHNYATAAKSPNSLVIVEPSNCDDNVIEVPFNVLETNVNDLDSLKGHNVITVQKITNNNNYRESGGGLIKVNKNFTVCSDDGDLEDKTTKTGIS